MLRGLRAFDLGSLIYLSKTTSGQYARGIGLDLPAFTDGIMVLSYSNIVCKFSSISMSPFFDGALDMIGHYIPPYLPIDINRS